MIVITSNTYIETVLSMFYQIIDTLPSNWIAYSPVFPLYPLRYWKYSYHLRSGLILDRQRHLLLILIFCELQFLPLQFLISSAFDNGWDFIRLYFIFNPFSITSSCIVNFVLDISIFSSKSTINSVKEFFIG